MYPYSSQHPVSPQPPSPVIYKAPIRTNGNIIGFGLLLLNLIPFVVLNPLLRLFYQVGEPLLTKYPDVSYQILNMIFYIVPFVVSIVFCIKLLDIPLQVAFPTRLPKADIFLCSIGIAMGAILFGSMLTGFLSSTLEMVTGYSPTSPEMTAPRGLTANILYFINIAILPAFLEEALFRGVILQSLRRFGDSFALITSAVLFGVVHGNFIQMPYTMFLGLIIGYFVLYSGSLWPGIAIHFANNGLSVLLEWITAGTTAAQDEMIYLLLFGGRLVLGILCLIILRLRLGSLFYIPPSSYPLEEKEKNPTFYTSIGIILFLLYSVFLFIQYLEPYVAG